MSVETPPVAGGLLDEDLRLDSGIDGRLLVYHNSSHRSALLDPGATRLLRFVRQHPDLATAAAAVASHLGCTRDEADRALLELHDRLTDARVLSERLERRQRNRTRMSRWLGTVPTIRVVRIPIKQRDTGRCGRLLSRRQAGSALLALPLSAVSAIVTLLFVGRHAPHATVTLVTKAASLPGHASFDIRALLPVAGLVAVACLANAVHEGAHAFACRCVGVAVQETGLALWWWVWPVWYIEHPGLSRLPDRRDHAVVAIAGPVAHFGLATLAGLLALAVPSGVVATFLAAATEVFTVAAVANLNPLVPTDGYRALEALSGRIGFRSAAILTVTRTLLRIAGRPMVRPLMVLAHWCYVVLCLGWGLVMVLGLIHLLTGAS